MLERRDPARLRREGRPETHDLLLGIKRRRGARGEECQGSVEAGMYVVEHVIVSVKGKEFPLQLVYHLVLLNEGRRRLQKRGAEREEVAAVDRERGCWRRAGCRGRLGRGILVE